MNSSAYVTNGLGIDIDGIHGSSIPHTFRLAVVVALRHISPGCKFACSLVIWSEVFRHPADAKPFWAAFFKPTSFDSQELN